VRKHHILGILGFFLLCLGSVWGLWFTPPETHMQDVNRIFFIHVPTALVCMLGFFSFIPAVGALITRGRRWDATMEAMVELTLVLSLMTLAQGMMWGKPTWGAYWDWDPRLTTTAVMAVLFAGVLSLRSFADRFEQRLIWGAVATIIACVDVPIVYMSVEWWDSLHQGDSTPSSVSVDYHWPMRANVFGILFFSAWLIVERARVALLRDEEEAADAPPPETPQDLVAGGD